MEPNKIFIKAESVSQYLHLPFLPSLHPFHLGHPSQVAPWDPWPQMIQGVLGSHQAPLDQGDYKRAVRCGWWCFGLFWVKRIVTGSRRVPANTNPHTSAAWQSLWSHQKQTKKELQFQDGATKCWFKQDKKREPEIKNRIKACANGVPKHTNCSY